MKTVIMIPARYASVRYPGKPLAELTQRDGSRKSLIQMSWEAAMAVKGTADVYVVTDDERIKAHCEGFGASVIMTSSSCENGTARCAEALTKAKIEADLVINLQGDAPLTPAWFVNDLIRAMIADPQAQVATPVLQCDPLSYSHFIEDRKADRVGATTAVFDTKGHALYFSKEVLPYLDPLKAAGSDIPVFHHVGLYAYRPEALAAYTSWPISGLEIHEGLEQLRFLANGVKVRCVIVEGRGQVFWELNNPEDVPRIETVLKHRVIHASA